MFNKFPINIPNGIRNIKLKLLGKKNLFLNIKNVITQRQFLKSMGIIKRAEKVAKKMKFTEQTNLYLRIKRLLSPRYMGDLFKVVLAYKFRKDNFAGF